MTYCMGGTGIIFSRKTILDIRPYLHQCLKYVERKKFQLFFNYFRSEIFSEHEDIELGRCFYEHLGLTCTNAWDASSYFWNNYRPKPLKPGQGNDKKYHNY